MILFNGTERKFGGARMKSDRNREIPVNIERSLWGISAGRCEFEGCNCFLGINPITMETGNYGEKAHIEAVSKGGARYREVMDVEELNSTDNLMLMCAKCHKTIDDNPEIYPVERLREMKKSHENRVYWLTEYDNVQQSYMVGYFANIKNYQPEFDNVQFCKALVSDKKIPSERYINLIGSSNMPFSDGTKEFYFVQEKQIEQGVERVIKQCIHENENISIFALAPIPLLMKLGEKISDIANISVFQCHRKEDKWSWDRDNKDIVNFIIRMPEQVNQKRVAINISLSADIIDSRVKHTVGEISTYKITIENPNRLFVTNKGIIDDYIKAFRNCMETIKNDNPEIEEVLVFPAMPNSLAIRTGMDYMPKCDPTLIIYDQVEQSKDFIETITIGGK